MARRIGTVLAAFAGVLGALTLSRHVLGWNLGIDQLLFSEPPGAGDPEPQPHGAGAR